MDFLSNLFGGLGSLFGVGGGNGGVKGAGQPGNTTQGTSNSMFGGGGGLGNLMGMFGGSGDSKQSGGMNPGMIGGGLGLMGLGQMMNKPVKMPDFNSMPQVQALQNFSTNPPQLPQSMQDEINKSIGIQQEQESRNLKDVYRNLRPGTDYTTDSAYQRDLANLSRQQSSERANALMGPTLQYLQPQQQNLQNLAELGVGQGMGGAALQAQRQQQQNQLMGQLASMMMMRGLGMPSFMNMFGQG